MPDLQPPATLSGTVVEIPYVFKGRTAGESKMNLREAVNYLPQLREPWRFRRSHPPLRQRYIGLTADQFQGGPLARS